MADHPTHDEGAQTRLPSDDPDPARAFWRLWRQGNQPDVKVFLALGGVTNPEMIAAVLRVDQRERRLRGESVAAEMYLSAFPAVGADAEAVVDLVFAEFLLREELGEQPALEEFVRRFPEHAEAIRLQIELHQAVDSAGALTLQSVDEVATPSIFTISAHNDPPTAYPSIPGFDIHGIIGRGGMGIVYRAWQTELKRLVALKMLLGGAHAPRAVLDRFHNEVEAIARLRHPGIVQIHEVGEAGGLPYCALEFVEGGSLADKLDGKPLPCGRAAAIVVQLARAIHSAHERGIVHRDLKPGNVLLTSEGEPKITDFGLAKLAFGDKHYTRTGDVMGTPSYMSPEQAQGRAQEVVAASDIYSLGVILYEMLAGRPPFLAATPAETIRQVIMDDPVPTRRLQPGLPRDLETICLKCLEKDPKRRYETALTLAEDIERWQDGLPIRARPTSISERLVKWARRRPAIAGLISAIVVITLAGFTGVLAQWQIAEAARKTAAKIAVAEKSMREKAESALYLNRVSVAGQLWTANNARGANQLLDRCRPDQRGWEWNYLKRLYHGGERSIREVSGLISMARSPDGHELATGSWAYDIRIWDVATGKERLTLVGHSAEVGGLAYHPDGTRLASGSADKTVRIWDTRTGQSIRSWHAHDKLIRGVAYSPDGTRVASGGDDGLVRIWNAETGALVRSLDGKAGITRTVAFSPDGHSLVSGHEDNVAIVWDPDSGDRRHTLAGHGVGVISLTFFAGGRQVVTGSFDGTARFWELDTGKPLRRCAGHRNAVNSVAVSPDERALATASWDGTIRLWDLTVPEDRFTIIRGHEGSVVGTVFLPDGRTLISASEDRTIRFWPLPHASESQVLQAHAAGTNTAQFSPDGSILASAGPEGAVRFWNARTGELIGDIAAFGTMVSGLAFSRDGKRLATAALESAVKVWDVAARRQIISFEKHTAVVDRIALSPDGQLVASMDGNTLHVWNVVDGSIRFTRKTPGRAYDVAFSPDGRLLAFSGGVDGAPGEVVLYDVDTWKPAKTLRTPDALLNRIAFSPNQRLLAAARTDKQVLVWDLPTGRMLRVLKGHNDWIFGMAFSPDGKRLATGGMDWTTKIWDVATGDVTLTLHGHTELIYSMSFSPDGRRLATASQDGAVRVWDASPLDGANAERWLVDEGPTGPGGVAFSFDGLTIATARENGEIQLRDARSGWETATLSGHNLPVRSMTFAAKPLLATASETPDGHGEVKVWDLASGLASPLPTSAPGVQVIAFLPGERLVTLDGVGFTIWSNSQKALKAIPIGDPTKTRDGASVVAGAVSPDGTLFVADDGRGVLTVWDDKRERRFKLVPSSPEPNFALEFSPDGRWLAAASANSGVRLWEMPDGRAQSFIQPSGTIRSLSFSSDGRMLALGDETGIIQLWDTSARSLVSHLDGYVWESITRVRFSPDGRTLASAAKMGSVLFWKLDSDGQTR